MSSDFFQWVCFKNSLLFSDKCLLKEKVPSKSIIHVKIPFMKGPTAEEIQDVDWDVRVSQGPVLGCENTEIFRSRDTWRAWKKKKDRRRFAKDSQRWQTKHRGLKFELQRDAQACAA